MLQNLNLQPPQAPQLPQVNPSQLDSSLWGLLGSYFGIGGGDYGNLYNLFNYPQSNPYQNYFSSLLQLLGGGQ